MEGAVRARRSVVAAGTFAAHTLVVFVLVCGVTLREAGGCGGLGLCTVLRPRIYHFSRREGRGGGAILPCPTTPE